MSDIERRDAVGQVSVRGKTKNAGPSVISGTAIVYGRDAVIGGMFTERIAVGAAASAISGTADIVALLNHDPNYVLGRTTARSLRLRDTPSGLEYEIDVNDADPQAISVAAKIARGDIHGSSFGFSVSREEWITPPADSDELPTRVILEFSRIFDVSPVCFPAYSATSATARDRS